MGSRLSDARGIAIIAVTKRGANLGAEICAALGSQAELHVGERWANDLKATPIPRPLADHLAALFPRVGGLVFVLAMGATVRLLAPLLSSKTEDPAVVVVDELGRHVISVLGGHQADANRLAERVADAIGATPIITTASDAHGLPSPDTIGREHGWTIEASPETLKRVSAAMLAGEAIALCQETGEQEPFEKAPVHWLRIKSLEELESHDGFALVATDTLLSNVRVPTDSWIVYRPKSLILGVGCSTGVAAAEITTVARKALEEAGLCWESVACVASIDRRLDEPGLRQFAERESLPVRGLSAAELAAVENVPNPSDEVARYVGTPSVCEAAAIIASDGGDLLIPKRRSSRATVAVARRRFQRSEGHLTLVGLGPGSWLHTTARARHALREADVIVGYRGYLHALQTALPGKRLDSYELGQEVQRARAAIELARGGERVALVSRGDSGIYGMAGVALELLDGERSGNKPQCDKLRIEVVPGVTAANAAAALLGAPLMLDFAAISLSDLLVPWAEIERRLEAAAAGDLVVALYNPASRRRQVQLGQAGEILLRHRSPATPVGIVRDAYGPDESVQLSTLADLPTAPVDMKTVVIVGNSATVRLSDRLVTRRGYRIEDWD